MEPNNRTERKTMDIKAIRDARKAYETAIEKAADSLEGMLKAAIKNTEGVTAIRWRQYTPYFNDGDACIFGVRGFYIKLDGDSTGGDYNDGFQNMYAIKDEKIKKLYDELCSIPSDVFELAFGDHVKVTVTATDVTVDEYQHD